MGKSKTLRGNYILFRYVIDGNIPVIEVKDRNGKYWYCKLVGEVFETAHANILKNFIIL